VRLRSEMSKRRPIKATGIAFQGRVGTAHLGKVSQRPAVESTRGTQQPSHLPS